MVVFSLQLACAVVSVLVRVQLALSRCTNPTVILAVPETTTTQPWHSNATPPESNTLQTLQLPLSRSARTEMLVSSGHPRNLFARQTAASCPTGFKICGTGCIDTTYTCCPDNSGGCPATDVCAVGANGLYGCCLIGATCTGNGAIKTTAISIVTASTSTISLVTTLYTTATPSSFESVSYMPTTTSSPKPSPTSAAEPDPSHHGLPTKTIIGIAVGAAALILIVVVGAFHMYRKYRHDHPHWAVNPNPLPVRPETAQQRWGPAELHNEQRESQMTMLRYRDSDSQGGLDMLAHGSSGRWEAMSDGNRHELGTHY